MSASSSQPQFQQPYPPQPQPGGPYPPQAYQGQQHPGQQYQGQPYPPQQQYAAPIIINNSVAASASAVAFGGGYGRRKRQSFWAHFWLFMFTAGIGNAIYAWYVSDWNKKHGR
ncbi:hypothetical protein [Streptomyces tailanensis]|uniref:hypothetical protein n=1 Tax=Streptomyces tailanensis TaxID=2569858 RepID=UPI001FEA38A4|nr:hypothetical protein [Streptomyces tailanensis]